MSQTTKGTVKQHSVNAELEIENAQLKDEIVRLKTLNDYYIELLRLAQHRRFGASSEKAEMPEQLDMFNEAEVLSDEEPELEQIAAHTRKKRKGKRDEFYEGIPTERIVHELPEDERICPECGGPLHACGHEVIRREVKIIPAQIIAEEHVQMVYV